MGPTRIPHDASSCLDRWVSKQMIRAPWCLRYCAKWTQEGMTVVEFGLRAPVLIPQIGAYVDTIVAKSTR